MRLIAEIAAPAEYAPCSTQAVLEGGRSLPPIADPFPRALWSPHAPLGLVLTIVTLLSIVWSTYAFVISQLIKVWKGAKP